MFAACGDRVVCTGCYSGVTDSHELLGYFDFAALLLVSCILRRSNSTADLQRHHSKLSLLVELLLRLLRRACGLDCLHH